MRIYKGRRVIFPCIPRQIQKDCYLLKTASTLDPDPFQVFYERTVVRGMQVVLEARDLLLSFLAWAQRSLFVGPRGDCVMADVHGFDSTNTSLAPCYPGERRVRLSSTTVTRCMQRYSGR